MSIFTIFGFQALWSPYFLLFISFIMTLYFLVIGRWSHRFEHSSPVEIRQMIYFVSGMLLLYLAIGGPFDLIGHFLFSVHMSAMLIIFLIVPPLLLKGIPSWMWRTVLQYKVIHKLFAFFTKPSFSLIIFNLLFSFYHFPIIFDSLKMNPLLHGLYITILFGAAIFMWWSIISPLPEWRTLSHIKRIGLLFGNGILLSPALLILIMADAPIYASYSDPTIWTQVLQMYIPSSALDSIPISSGAGMVFGVSTLSDQQIGGIIMKAGQEFIFIIALAKLFFAWVKKEKERDPSLSSEYYTPKQLS